MLAETRSCQTARNVRVSRGGDRPSAFVGLAVPIEAQPPATRRRRNSTSRWFEQRRQAMQKLHRCSLTLGRCDLTSILRLRQTLMWFYNDPSLYDKLVRQRGWSVDRFQAWLTEALQVQLLGKAPSVRTAE